MYLPFVVDKVKLHGLALAVDEVLRARVHGLVLVQLAPVHVELPHKQNRVCVDQLGRARLAEAADHLAKADSSPYTLRATDISD